MKSSIGTNITLCIFGESHSAAIGGVLDGLAAGIRLDLQNIDAMLEKRRAKGRISTARTEADKVKFLSGYFDGYTTGTPLCFMIENENTRSQDYSALRNTPRPSHADYTAHIKYDGFEDYRGGGHFSGRLTAPMVVAGAICMQILKEHGIQAGTHIASLHGTILDLPFAQEKEALSKQLALLSCRDFPTISDDAAQQMQACITTAAQEGDSVGGILETAICGMPVGVGEPLFYSVESVLSHLFFSIPAVKGVEFGCGFDITKLYGSGANDRFTVADGAIKTITNHNGGINGGITNGMPILARLAVKPTPSIFKEQQTVDLAAMKDTILTIKGRHDPAIIHRAAIVATAMAAFGLVDLCTEQFGIAWQKNGGK